MGYDEDTTNNRIRGIGEKLARIDDKLERIAGALEAMAKQHKCGAEYSDVYDEPAFCKKPAGHAGLHGEGA